MSFDYLLIDLDETVYPTTCGVWDAIAMRMEEYIHDRLAVPREQIPALRKSLYQQYGTTLRGLQATREVDVHDYLAFVHDVPLDDLLQPDPQLHDILKCYTQRKIIFTNADRQHASRVLNRLGLEDCFDQIIDIIDIAPYCKPMPEAFAAAVRLAGASTAEQCVFIDDSARNLAAARAAGMFTVQVGHPKAGFQHPDAQAHVHIDRLIDLPTVLKPES